MKEIYLAINTRVLFISLLGSGLVILAAIAL
jgi:hypothetical protein